MPEIKLNVGTSQPPTQNRNTLGFTPHNHNPST